MTKLLFLGCNHDQIPYLMAARDAGYTVVGTDLNPDAPGAALADRFHVASYTNVEALVQAAETAGFGPADHIFTAAAHFAWEGAAGVAARLGIEFPAPLSVDTCLDKSRFYALLASLDVPCPPTITLAAGEEPVLDPGRAYYLKSDYGKSPRYCYRVASGRLPDRPAAFDQFYRRCFLLQEAVNGLHIRVDLYGDQAAVFLKISEQCVLPMPTLGFGHDEIVAGLRRVSSALGLDRILTKFDVINGPKGWFVIDIGLDPPMRLRHLCRYRGVDFDAAYVRGFLSGDWTGLPRWDQLADPPVLLETSDGTARIQSLADVT